MTTPLTNLTHPAGYEFFRFLDGANGRSFTIVQTGHIGPDTYQDVRDMPQADARKLHAGLVAIGYKPATV